MKHIVVFVIVIVLAILSTAVCYAQDGYPGPQTPVPTEAAYPVNTPLATAVMPSATPGPSPTVEATAVAVVTMPATPAPWETPSSVGLGGMEVMAADDGSGTVWYFILAVVVGGALTFVLSRREQE